MKCVWYIFVQVSSSNLVPEYTEYVLCTYPVQTKYIKVQVNTVFFEIGQIDLLLCTNERFSVTFDQ
jgi:hypothetical protein